MSRSASRSWEDHYHAPHTQARSASPLVRRLFELMESKRITVSEMASKLDMSRVGLYYWRSGRCTPPVTALEAAYQTLGIDLADFMPEL